MTEAKFVIARFPEGELASVRDRSSMAQRVHRFIPPRARARIREIGGEWSQWRGERDSVHRILERVDRMGVGPKLIVQRESDREMLSIRELTSTPDLGAAPDIEEIHGEIWAEFEVRSGGLWLCRYVDGTSIVSRHGFLTREWRGAAEDVFVTEGGMPALVDVAEFVVDRTRRGLLNARTVIVDQDIWTPDSGWRVYSGRPHYHGHFDVAGGWACRP